MTIDNNLMARNSIAVPLPSSESISINQNNNSIVTIQKQHLDVAQKTKLILNNIFYRTSKENGLEDPLYIISQYATYFSRTNLYQEIIANIENKVFMTTRLTNLFNSIFILFSNISSSYKLPSISSFSISNLIKSGIGSFNDIKFIITCYLLVKLDLGDFFPNLFTFVYNNTQEFYQTHSPKPDLIESEKVLELSNDQNKIQTLNKFDNPDYKRHINEFSDFIKNEIKKLNNS